MNNNELYHWGIKGQKWGVRRFQNEDGTLTEAGVAKYKEESKTATRKASLKSQNVKAKNERLLVKEQARAERSIIKEQSKADNMPAILRAKNERTSLKNQEKLERMNNKTRKQRSKLIAATTVAVAAIGAYALTKNLKGSATKVKDISSDVIDADFTVINPTVTDIIPLPRH